MTLYDYIVVVFAILGGAGVMLATVLLGFVLVLAWKEFL